MTPDQIKRFFNNSCNAEEAKEVADFLKQNPGIAEEYLPKSEFDNVKNIEVPDDVWQKSWAYIQKHKKARLIASHVIRWSAAASIIGLLYLGYSTWNRSAPEKIVGLQKDKPLRELKFEEKTITNRGNSNETIILEDHSVITLYPSSTVKYLIQFATGKRDIHLTGSARFKVAKDKAKPFTVYAGSLATTAIGTEFRVTQKNKKVTVKLYEGKVVIRAVTDNLKGWQHDIYLLSGQEMNYNSTGAVIKNGKENNTTFEKSKLKNINNVLAFTNEPLPKVFKKLTAHYHVEIKFEESELASKNFTGTITSRDSLSFVLKVITQMNELELMQEDDGYFIRNKQENKRE